jgi:hypothetical protein
MKLHKLLRKPLKTKEISGGTNYDGTNDGILG